MNHRNALAPATFSNQENHILQALADVRKLVYYKLSSLHRDSAEDLMQRVFYKVWSWKTRHDKVLEYEEWQKLIRTVVYREISEYFNEKYTSDILFSQINNDLKEVLSTMKAGHDDLEGNTRAEVESILSSLWKASQILNLRQRYAFVLYNESFLIEFINAKLCGFEELAAYFEVSEEIFSEIMNFLPLSDGQIGEMLGAKLNESITPQQIWEARSKAKARLIQNFRKTTK